jgi:molecular chaperone DnaJ
MLEKMQKSKNFQPNPEKNEKSFFDKVREMFG